jgi:hypothetical protein
VIPGGKADGARRQNAGGGPEDVDMGRDFTKNSHRLTAELAGNGAACTIFDPSC